MGLKTLLYDDWRKRRLLQQFRKIERKFGGDIAIRGSYTGNLGDILIGNTLKDYLSEQGRTPKLFSGIHEDFEGWNYLVLGGGQIIQNDVKRIKSQSKSALSAKGFSIHAVGVSELEKAGNEDLEFLNQADKISVRDKRSQRNLEKFTGKNIQVTADPVFSLNSEYGDKENSKNKVGVNFRPIEKDFFLPFTQEEGDEEDLDSYDEYCRKLWEKLNSGYDDVKYIPFDLKDKRYAESIGITSGKLRKPYNLIDYIDREISDMVCTRYHSLILGLITDKNVKVISYGPKVQSLAERIDIDHTPIHELPDEPDIEFTDTPSAEVRRLENLANEDLERLYSLIKGKGDRND